MSFKPQHNSQSPAKAKGLDWFGQILDEIGDFGSNTPASGARTARARSQPSSQPSATTPSSEPSPRVDTSRSVSNKLSTSTAYSASPASTASIQPPLSNAHDHPHIYSSPVSASGGHFLPQSNESRTPSSASKRQNAETTIGISVRGRVVEFVVPGGPAHLSQKVETDDEIFAVNGIHVSKEELSDAIIADDVANRVVVLSILKSSTGTIEHVALKRISKRRMKNAVSIFELLTQLKENGSRTLDFEQEFYGIKAEPSLMLLDRLVPLISSVLKEQYIVQQNDSSPSRSEDGPDSADLDSSNRHKVMDLEQKLEEAQARLLAAEAEFERETQILSDRLQATTSALEQYVENSLKNISEWENQKKILAAKLIKPYHQFKENTIYLERLLSEKTEQLRGYQNSLAAAETQIRLLERESVAVEPILINTALSVNHVEKLITVCLSRAIHKFQELNSELDEHRKHSILLKENLSNAHTRISGLEAEKVQQQAQMQMLKTGLTTSNTGITTLATEREHLQLQVKVLEANLQECRQKNLSLHQTLDFEKRESLALQTQCLERDVSLARSIAVAEQFDVTVTKVLNCWEAMVHPPHRNVPGNHVQRSTFPQTGQEHLQITEFASPLRKVLAHQSAVPDLSCEWREIAVDDGRGLQHAMEAVTELGSLPLIQNVPDVPFEHATPALAANHQYAAPSLQMDMPAQHYASPNLSSILKSSVVDIIGVKIAGASPYYVQEVLGITDEHGSTADDKVNIGDELVEVDGWAVGALSAAEVLERLDGPPGTIVVMRFRDLVTNQLYSAALLRRRRGAITEAQCDDRSMEL